MTADPDSIRSLAAEAVTSYRGNKDLEPTSVSTAPEELRLCVKNKRVKMRLREADDNETNSIEDTINNNVLASSIDRKKITVSDSWTKITACLIITNCFRTLCLMSVLSVLCPFVSRSLTWVTPAGSITTSQTTFRLGNTGPWRSSSGRVTDPRQTSGARPAWPSRSPSSKMRMACWGL